MKLALRTSGGRGEYELAGSQGIFGVANLIDHEIILELLPQVKTFTGNTPRKVQGKPRIRLNNRQLDRHIYLILADLLLLPIPKREIKTTSSGQVVFADNDYSITAVSFDIVDVDSTHVVIRPTQLTLSNSSDSHIGIDVIERMMSILALWANTRGSTSPIASQIQNFEKAFMHGNKRDLAIAVKSLRRSVSSTHDPLINILRQIGLADYTEFPDGITGEQTYTHPPEDIQTTIDAAKIERVKEWKLQASRGSSGRNFRTTVNQAYNWTCLFTGYHLPKIEHTSSAGVEAAHILPWASYDLNIVSNGICLNKLCHWAFDSGILQLDFNRTLSRYEVSIPKKILDSEISGIIDLQAFRPIIGPIPQNRLPHNKALWPNPDYIDAFNNES